MNRLAQIAINLCYQVQSSPNKTLADAAIATVCNFVKHNSYPNTPLIDSQAITIEVYEELYIPLEPIT